MAGIVQNTTSSAYLNSLNVPINVTAVSKLQNFQYIQQLTYAGILPYIAKDFHGLNDWRDQMTIYSSTNLMLTSAWNSIKPIATKNIDIQPKMYEDPVLGQVGTQFLTMPTYGAVFTVTPSTSPKDISSMVSASI